MDFIRNTLLAGLADTPLLWSALTLLAYLAALKLYQKSGRNPLLLPAATGVIVIILLLKLTGTPYAAYHDGTRLFHFFVGPVIVALAVPLYQQLARLKAHWFPLCVATVVGSVVGILSGVLIAWALGGSEVTMLSIAGKSATMPIAMALADKFHGLVAIAAVSVFLAGFGGVVMARPLLNLLRIQDPAVRGFSIGLTSHALGTARALQHNETAGAFAALGMALNGVVTPLALPLLLWATHWLGVLG